MKITIDLNDPHLQQQLESQINAKLQELIAATVQARIDHVVATKTGRITDVWIENVLRSQIEARLQASCKTNWQGGTGELREIVTTVAQRIIREALTKPGTPVTRRAGPGP